MNRHRDQEQLPRNSVLVKSDPTLFEHIEIYSLLHLKKEEITDDQIKYYMATAINWVEDHLGKTLLTTTRESVSYNNRFVLPYGPVNWSVSDNANNKEIIKKVIYGKKELKQDEYSIRVCGDSVEIQVPFSWKERALTVQYVAGYSNKEAVPASLKNAVLGTIEYLFNNNGNVQALEAATAPWLQGYRTYRIV